MKNNLSHLRSNLRKKIKPGKKQILEKFFKTGKGQYAEGDIFLGVMVPQTREIVKKYKDLNIKHIENLLNSKFHEERLTGLLILVKQFQKAEDKQKKEIYKFYISHLQAINNWDLVDLTAPNIVGNYLLNKKRNVLYALAKDKGLWKRRIAIISTFIFIRQKDFTDTLKISELLLKDKEDLIHKATGWMLREVGKKDKKALTNFLDKHHKKMPRTMLRYSLERLNKKQKEFYMRKCLK